MFDANTSIKRMRSQRLDDLLDAVSVGSGARLARRQGRGQAAQHERAAQQRAAGDPAANVVYGKPQPPDEQLMLELRRRFKGEVVALSEYLGRDLVNLWGYDRLD